MREALKVLVVATRPDDIERMRDALVAARLDSELHPVGTLGDVERALAEPWDAVLTSDRVGEHDSLAVLARVREHDGDVPVLVVSPPVGEARAVEVMLGGVDEFVLTGDVERLARAIREHLRVARERRRRRDAEAAAAETEQDLRQLVEELPLGIVVRQGDTVVFVNRATADAFGVEPSALVGRPLLELLRPECHELMRARIAATERGDVRTSLELRFDRADGRIGIMQVISSKRVRFGGRPSVLSTWRDVTDERAMRDRLLMADRMAAVGTLAAGVAHEINNPLACVTANLELLREELAAPRTGTSPMSPEEMLAALDDAREGAERVRLIVRDLRLFARGDSGERGPVDLGGVLQAAERMASNMMKQRARVVQEHAPLPPVDGNATRLCQVFVNILVNAAQAIAAGAPDANEVRVKAAHVGGEVVVEVHDTGVGIPPEVKSRIFDPFFSTKGIGGGHGLGLSVCHGIVTSFGGNISIADPPSGRGTVVRVALPVYNR